ncbi:alpha-L-fucosidase [Labilibaculum sp.]|uniref:alpha-L-fucosidase n=1 Tax=Labilibaculum sp. TaxID=2060723 RepID=UPI00356417BF
MKTKLIAIVFLMMTLASCNKKVTSDSNEITDEERMEWWQEARFGMFIHWGIYSVPAGFYKGEAQTNSGEWIMNKGKIPIAEYEKFAGQFNPTDFDAKAFVGLAKEAGMKYIVITAKHHDGFAMFHSKCNPFNIVDATPFKRDVLKELSEECQKQGLRFGFYYSQAQDWHHPGGMGNNWDKTIKRVSSEEYILEKALPEVNQLLTEYGPISIFWWDTPRDMGKEVVDSLYRVTTALQPAIITNDRLGEDYPGDHKTYERRIPHRAPKDKYWEECMPIRGSWGHRSDDRNYKSKTILIRNLVDIASKGGNYLLNVGPTAQGTLLPESVERLKYMGQWMKRNSESIYATQASPCTQAEWGRVTMKINDQKATLYLNVFNWKNGADIALDLNNNVEACYLLEDSERSFLTESSKEGIVVKLTGEAVDTVSTVIVLKLDSLPNRLPLKDIAQDEKGNITLLAERAEFQSLDAPGAEYDVEFNCIGSWNHEKAKVYWTFNVKEAGTFTLESKYTAEKQSKFTLSLAGQSGEVTLEPTKSRKRFNKVNLGEFDIPKVGEYTLSIKPVMGEWNAVQLQDIYLNCAK